MMEVISGARGCGKTTRLIKKSHETGIYILVADRNRANTLAKHAKSIGCVIPYPVTVEEFLSGAKFEGSSIRRDGIYIDDVDDVLKKLLSPLDIKAITYTE